MTFFIGTSRALPRIEHAPSRECARVSGVYSRRALKAAGSTTETRANPRLQCTSNALIARPASHDLLPSHKDIMSSTKTPADDRLLSIV